MTSVHNSNKAITSVPRESQFKETVFRICNGSLIVSPKNNKMPIYYSGDYGHKISEVEGELNKSGKDEVYIEIIRESSTPPDLSVNEDTRIENISSAYEAFWKGSFEECLERRTCPKCCHIFLTPKQLFHHLKTSHSISGPTVCFVCYKVFAAEIKKHEHLQKLHHIPSPDLTCEVCYEMFINESEKNIHRLQHASTEKCKWCMVSFPCQYLLSEHHLQNLCSKKHHNCDICGCHFTSSHILQLHSLRHSRKACDLCGFKMNHDPNHPADYHEISFIKHLKSMHDDQEIENILLRLKKQDEEEEILDKLFMIQIQSSISEFSDIQLTVDSNVLMEENVLKNPNVPLTKHGQDLKNEAQLISEDRIFQCSECSKNFDSKKKLMVHALDHQTPFSCEICKLSFQHRRGFKKHMRCHGVEIKPGSTRYNCVQCSVNCSTLSGLRTHILTHTEHKPHLCDKCGLTFRRLQALRMHEIAVHNAKTLHMCPHCGSSSTSKKSLLRHIQCVHAGVRRFICGLCCARFLQNQDLRRHLKSVHKLDFPPLQCLLKKSNSQIHVIPSAESVNLEDSVTAMLKSAVKEEELKLKSFRKCKRTSTSNCESQPELLKIETSADGLPLNILGDVASKAIPLEQIKPCPLDKFSDLLMCKGSKSAPVTTLPTSADATTSSKHTIMYSVAPLQGCTSNPYNLCVLPSQNSFLLSDSGFPTMNSDGLVCSILPGLHMGSNLSQSTSLDVQNLNNRFLCSDGGSTSNLTISCDNYLEGESITLNQSDPSRILSILSVGNLEQTPLELLDQSTTTVQEEYLSKNGKCALNYGEGSFLVKSNHRSGDIETEVMIKDRILQLPSQHRNRKSTFLPSVPNNSQLASNEETIDISCQNTITFIDHFESKQSAQSPEPTSTVARKILADPQPAKGSSNDENYIEEDPLIKKGFIVRDKIKKNNEITSQTSKTSRTLQSQNSLGNVSSYATNLKTNSLACPECGKKLANASNFKRHLEVHSGLKLHECLYCGKSFRYKHNLTVHIRCHTGDRPYECNECTKRFRYLQEFKEHKQIHETSKLFSCLDCGQRFARQRDLRRHSLSHSAKNKPTCTICQKTFSRIDYLNIHIRSHKKTDELGSVSCLSQSKEKMSKDKITKEESSTQDKMSVSPCTSANMLGSDKVSVSKTSEDLISLAFQAAEDGVEFMFVEESTSTVDKTNAKTHTSVEENVIYLKVLE